MTIEDTVRASLAERLDSLDVPPGDLAAALREGSSARRRRPIVTGLVAAACLAAVAVTGVALSQRDASERPEPAPAPGSGDWTKLPAAPLSPRANALTVWTGEELLVVGGEVDDLCPPAADCVSPATLARDGAAYDPESRRWRTVAPAPVPVVPWARHAVVDGLVVVGWERGWFSYDPAADLWRDLPPPPTGLGGTLDELSVTLSVLDGKVHTLSRDGRVLALEPRSATWSALPLSPHRTALDAQDVVATPEGVVVLGTDPSTVTDGTRPNLLLAEVWDGTSWTRLGAGDVLAAWSSWHWTGERVVAPYAECVDGGEVNNYGRCIPTGGALDPASKAWATVPPAPRDQPDHTWSLHAVEGPRVVTWGQVYDDRDESWTPVERPDGAPTDGTSAAFGDGTLYAFGGVDWGRRTAGELSGDAWAWTP